MCGRYGRRGDKQRIAEWMQTHNTDVFDESDETNLAPSFNVAPQSFQPVVRLNGNSIRAIAEEVGKSPNTVLKLLKGTSATIRPARVFNQMTETGGR